MTISFDDAENTMRISILTLIIICWVVFCGALWPSLLGQSYPESNIDRVRIEQTINNVQRDLDRHIGSAQAYEQRISRVEELASQNTVLLSRLTGIGIGLSSLVVLLQLLSWFNVRPKFARENGNGQR